MFLHVSHKTSARSRRWGGRASTGTRERNMCTGCRESFSTGATWRLILKYCVCIYIIFTIFICKVTYTWKAWCLASQCYWCLMVLDYEGKVHWIHLKIRSHIWAHLQTHMIFNCGNTKLLHLLLGTGSASESDSSAWKNSLARCICFEKLSCAVSNLMGHGAVMQHNATSGVTGLPK